MKDNRAILYKFSKVDEILSKYDGKRPGAVVAAVKDGQEIYKKAVGLGNLEYEIPLGFNSVFNLASISKPITAMGIMVLNEKGKIKYDDEIIKFFPELSHYCKDVTIRHLLNHTSGIVNYYRILDKRGINELHLTNKECYELLVKENSLLFSPGEEFDYSNSNYVLLAMLIEQVSGKELNDFLKGYIFEPLGMNDTLVFDEKQPIVKNRAYGYANNEGDFRCNYTGPLTTGDGCIFSSINDMIAFEKALYSDKIVSKDSLKVAFTSGALNNGEDVGYGYGIETHRSTPSLKRLHHSGTDNGFRALFTTFPQLKLTVILLSNSEDFSWDDRLSITDIFVDEFTKYHNDIDIQLQN